MDNVRKLKNPSDFHLGKHIKDELFREGRTITWLANELGCTRDNLYKIFQHGFVNTDLLFRICAAMRHDFFKDCSDILKLNQFQKTNGCVNKKG